MKKLISILLTVLILASFVGCAKDTKNNGSDANNTIHLQIDNSSTETGTNSSEEDITSSETNDSKNTSTSSQASNKTTSTTNKKPATTNTTVKPPVNEETITTGTIDKNSKEDGKIEVTKPQETVKPVIPPKQEEEKSENGNDIITGGGDVQVEDIPATETPPEQEEVPEIKEEIVVNTKHTALAADKYYQYSSLNATQKKAYNAMIDAIKEGRNIIDVSEYNIPQDTAFLIIGKVLTDHPEYFYVSRNTALMYNPITGNATTLIIYYTDGKTVDKLENNQIITADNRDNIAKQIKTFNTKVEEILKKIPVNASQIEKELMIRNYIIDNAYYDYDAIEIGANLKHGDATPHMWTAYGGIVEGNIVCEGYSKAFAYLCREVGINATLVSGYSGNAGHMWNAVQIENDWYMVDITWDDIDYQYPSYEFFNVTTEKLNKTHAIDSELAYPSCTATKNSFLNVYTLNVVNDTLPSNYKTFIDNAIKSKEKYLLLNVGEDGTTLKFLRENFLNQYAPVTLYLKEKGYNVEIQASYAMVAEILYLTIVYK